MKQARVPRLLESISIASGFTSAFLGALIRSDRPPTPLTHLRVIRPEDFLLLELEFFNLGLVATQRGEPPIMVPTTALAGIKPAIVFQFQPQSAGEETFPEEPSPEEEPFEPTLEFGPIRAEFAGPSRLAFELPADFAGAPFTLESLLALCFHNSNFPLWRPHIEAPFLLILRPTSGRAGWKHAVAPVTHDGRTELWHTRMGMLKPGPEGDVVDERERVGRTLRALSQHDWPTGVQPFRLPLDQAQRQAIVDASVLTQIPVNRLMLSALGAWLDVDGEWENPSGPTPPIEAWQNRMTLGRDHSVRTAEPGYLYPFGHRAVLITITERKFQDSALDRAAFLRQRRHIVVRDPGRTLLLDDFPFTSLTILNPVTPDLISPDESAILDERNGHAFSFGSSAFYPRMLMGDRITDVLFHLRGNDRFGRPVEFHLPLLFVKAATAAANPFTMVIHYNEDEGQESRRHIVLGGQAVAYAGRGDASLDSDGMRVRAVVAAGEPPVRPRMDAAIVRVPAVNTLTGKNDPVEIDYFPTPNTQGVFATVHNPGASLHLPTDLAGGLTAPEYFISGLSSDLGPVGGTLGDVAGGNFDPQDFFKGFSPLLLGGLKLPDILGELHVPDSFVVGDGSRVPRLVREVSPTAIKTILTWTPPVKSSDNKIFLADRNGAPALLMLRTELTTPRGGGQPHYSLDGRLVDFTVQLLPPLVDLVRLPFKSLHFHAETGKKTDVSAELDTVKFVGPLSFVNELASRIPLDGFKDPPSVDVTPSGVDVNYSLGLPAIAMGYFSLQNVLFAAGLRLPFIGDPATLRLAFSERHSPFLLTVSAIGGGGFFGLELSLKGIQRIEFALEFGGNLAFDIGVASGGVLLMAGIYYENNAGQVRLTGYVRVSGAVEVLGLVCISVQFYLGLEYDVPGAKAWGVATLTVEVEVLFFSKDVSLTVRREFPKGGDPTFADLIPDVATWQAYCDAFADYEGVA